MATVDEILLTLTQLQLRSVFMGVLRFGKQLHMSNSTIKAFIFSQLIFQSHVRLFWLWQSHWVVLKSSVHSVSVAFNASRELPGKWFVTHKEQSSCKDHPGGGNELWWMEFLLPVPTLLRGTLPGIFFLEFLEFSLAKAVVMVRIHLAQWCKGCSHCR